MTAPPPASTPFQIVHLVDAPGAAAVLQRWFIAEWAPWYGPGGAGNAAADLAACHHRDRLPICLVALDTDGRPVGTAALKTESVGSELGVGPWLAAVLVPAAQRGRGIGSVLVAAIEQTATRLGHEAIYTSTDTAQRILERRGWRAMATVPSLRGTLDVYRWSSTPP